MTAQVPEFQVFFADGPEQVAAAQRLRYQVFGAELGAIGESVDPATQLERDRYDSVARHLLLIDRAGESGPEVVGTCRLIDSDAAAAAGGFYSAEEFDLSPLLAHGGRLLEMGRSCVAPAYRGGTAMHVMWGALADFVDRARIDILFGVASFHGTDAAALDQPLSWLRLNRLAPPELRVRAHGAAARPLGTLTEAELDRRAAMLATPSLIKAYLRLGGYVGEGAWLDHGFNTTDVCMVLQTARIDPSRRALVGRGP